MAPLQTRGTVDVLATAPVALQPRTGGRPEKTRSFGVAVRSGATVGGAAGCVGAQRNGALIFESAQTTTLLRRSHDICNTRRQRGRRSLWRGRQLEPVPGSAARHPTVLIDSDTANQHRTGNIVTVTGQSMTVAQAPTIGPRSRRPARAAANHRSGRARRARRSFLPLGGFSRT